MDIRSGLFLCSIAGILLSSFPTSSAAKHGDSAKVEIKLNQTKVNGLLVMSLGGNKLAGTASPMTLSALRADGNSPATVEFNQKVGKMMDTALEEVTKYIELRHDAWPKGRKMEISFENKYNPKDGPSAAVACALLLNSAITGSKIDPGFAVTGDMNADGSVQPIGGVEAKVRGATNRDCTHIAIPSKNVPAVYDAVLIGGMAPLMKIQVFSISDFDEAFALARAERGAGDKVQSALDEFAKVQAVYRKNPKGFGKTLRHPKMVEKLEAISDAAPNHLSAKILLAYARGNQPKSLSLAGSVSFIEKNAYEIFDVIENGRVAAVQGLDKDQVADALSLLRRTKPKLDERTWDWINELMSFGNLLREYQTNRPGSVTNHNRLVGQINKANTAARTERETLMKNPEVIEELMQ
ncbi:MAG: S16 family serine protease [Verrucomicrobiales bacterium]